MHQEINLPPPSNLSYFEKGNAELTLKDGLLSLCYAKQSGNEATQRVLIDLSQQKIIRTVRYPLMPSHSFFNATLVLGRDKKIYLEDFNQLIVDDERVDIRLSP